MNVCTAAGTCACATKLSTVATVTRDTRASVIEVAGRPRVLYSLSNRTDYVECLMGCDSATPLWSAPLNLGSGSADSDVRPVLRVDDAGTISAAWSANNVFLFTECPGNCTSLASWSARRDITSGLNSSHTAAYDVRGPLHAALYETDAITDGGGAIYAECTSNCTASAASWPGLAFACNPSGADLKLTLLVDGGVRRSLAIYCDVADELLFAECESGCLSAGSWSQLRYGNGKDPELVIDRQGLPRIFSIVRNASPNRVRLTRCEQRPCSQGDNWATGNLLAGDFVTAGVLPGGATFFLTSTPRDAGAIVTLGIEDAGSGYTTSPVSACTGPLQGTRPAGYPGPQGQLRLGEVAPGGALNFLYQPP